MSDSDGQEDIQLSPPAHYEPPPPPPPAEDEKTNHHPPAEPPAATAASFSPSPKAASNVERVRSPTAATYTPIAPKESSHAMLWLSQLFVLLKTNAILTFVRGWKATLLTVLAPIVFLLLLYILQVVSLNYGITQNLAPVPYTIPGIIDCQVRDPPFFSLFPFSPHTHPFFTY